MKPRLVRGGLEEAEKEAEREGRWRVWKTWWTPGDVGGRGSGAEDVECVPLRWLAALRGGLGDGDAGTAVELDDEGRALVLVLVLVKVTVSSICSPAK